MFLKKLTVERIMKLFVYKVFCIVVQSSSHSSFVHGHIKLYRDEQFLNEITQIPAVVHENELLYVEVGVNASKFC